jgi:hypothetical protein
VAVNTGVVKSVPDISEVPPVGASNQSIIPEETVACKLATEPEQMDTLEVFGNGGSGNTFAVTATGWLTHPLVVATT